MKICLNVEMTLCSDTIFGSGYSIPGGEDIAVCQDELGYPYLKGSTFKGLLRDGMEHIIAWTNTDIKLLDQLFGCSGMQEETGDKIQVTSLTLQQVPRQSKDCYDTRVFTALSSGVVKEGSLRNAVCIREGLKFSGNIYCQKMHADILIQAIHAIKWVGTMRSRGFGRVSFRANMEEIEQNIASLPKTHCIHYQLHNLLPICITDWNRSSKNNIQTRSYIPGSAVRGMVLEYLSQKKADWFEVHKQALLHDVQFLDALPCRADVANLANLPPLPAIKGFYEDKTETTFTTVLKDGIFPIGLKRAKLGEYCIPKQTTLYYWDTKTSQDTRININQKEVFSTAYLSAHQTFDGHVILKDVSLAPFISEAFTNFVWLGADRYEGYGQCKVELLEAVSVPAYRAAYGYTTQTPEQDLYLLCMSPMMMYDHFGECCGLDLEALAQMLEVDTVKIQTCSTSTTEYGAFNRTWGCWDSSVRMYDRGSIFHLHCSSIPTKEALYHIEENGLGIRTAEGYGQVLFLRSECIEALNQKSVVSIEVLTENQKYYADLRRERYTWILNHVSRIKNSSLSKSQIGTIQAYCEYAIANNNDTSVLYRFLEKNCSERGARHGKRFQEIHTFVTSVLQDTIELPCHKDTRAKLEMLCELFDFSRKGI